MTTTNLQREKPPTEIVSEIYCRCGWMGYRTDLVPDTDIEYMHPANRGRVFKNEPLPPDVHITKAEKCPKCGRWLFADDKPTGLDIEPPNPPTEPTVEKWERIDVENLAYQIVYKIGDEIIPTGVGTLTSKRLAEEIEPILTKAISLSVQEAKEEGAREILRDIDNLQISCAKADGVIDGITALHQLRVDLLASLKQEEEL